MYELSSLFRVSPQWQIFIKNFLGHEMDCENMRTCLLLIYYRLEQLSPSLTQLNSDDAQLKEVDQLLINNYHLISPDFKKETSSLSSISLEDLFCNAFLKKFGVLIPRLGFHMARMQNSTLLRKRLTFDEIQMHIAVEMFLRANESDFTSVDSMDVENYIQKKQHASFAAQLISSVFAYFAVNYLSIDSDAGTPNKSMEDFSPAVSIDKSESIQFNRRMTEPSPNRLSRSIHSLIKNNEKSSQKNLKRNQTSPAMHKGKSENLFRASLASSSHDSVRFDRGDYLISSPNNTTREDSFHVFDGISDIGSITTTAADFKAKFNFLEIVPKATTELGQMFLVDFFKILSRLVKRMSFNTKISDVERLRLDFFSTMSISPFFEPVTAFLTDEDVMLKKNLRKFKQVCVAMANSEVVTCLVLSGKEWRFDDLSTLLDSFNHTTNLSLRENYQVDLVVPLGVELDESNQFLTRSETNMPRQKSNVKLAELSFADMESCRSMEALDLRKEKRKSYYATKKRNVLEYLVDSSTPGSPSMERSASTLSFTRNETENVNNILQQTDGPLLKWPSLMKRVYLTELNDNFLFNDRWHGLSIAEIHLNFAMNLPPLNFDPLLHCRKYLKTLYLTDCTLSSKHIGTNFVKIIQQLESLETLSLERANFGKEGWNALFADYLSNSSAPLKTIRIIECSMDWQDIQQLCHVMKKRTESLVKLELNLKGFEQREGLGELVEDLMLNGKAKTVIADYDHDNSTPTTYREKRKRKCIIS